MQRKGFNPAIDFDFDIVLSRPTVARQALRARRHHTKPVLDASPGDATGMPLAANTFSRNDGAESMVGRPSRKVPRQISAACA